MNIQPENLLPQRHNAAQPETTKDWRFEIGQQVGHKDGCFTSTVRYRERTVMNREIYGVDASDDERGLRFFWGGVLEPARVVEGSVGRDAT